MTWITLTVFLNWVVIKNLHIKIFKCTFLQVKNIKRYFLQNVIHHKKGILPIILGNGYILTNLIFILTFSELK